MTEDQRQLLENCRHFKRWAKKSPESYNHPETPFFRVELEKNSPEFIALKNYFVMNGTISLSADRIERIENLPLLLDYLGTKEYIFENFEYATEKLLFHGTDSSNLNSICETNFDITKVLNGMFGFGISFAADSWYASFYGDKDKENKTMIISYVSNGNPQQVGRNVTGRTLSEGYDSTVSGNGRVYVHFTENAFYPAYIVHYKK